MSSKPAYILPWALLLAVAGCSPAIDAPDIRDVTSLKQDCRAYVAPAAADKPLIEPARLAHLNDAFRRQWMRPWDPQSRPPEAEVVRKAFTNLETRPGYAENLLPHVASFAQELMASASLGDYPNRADMAITIRNTNLRVLPTLRPRFEAINKAGEGYPFDSLQESAIWAGTPLLLCHASVDGAWVFVDSSCGVGWVPRQDVATLDEESLRRYQGLPLVAVIKDNVPVTDAETGALLFATHIGAVLPLIADRPDGLEVVAVARDIEGKAVLRRAVLAKSQAVAIPLDPTPANVAMLANEMLGDPYGWGGLFEGRDCSATTRDLMAPFGIYLPRNSSGQARAYRGVTLKGLPGPQKEQLILEKGVPFMTLISLPGHVALYIGGDNGRAIIMHNFWGIRTRRDGVEGRKIVGRCVITSLQPGAELSDLDQPRDYRDRLENMVFVGIEEDEQASTR